MRGLGSGAGLGGAKGAKAVRRPRPAMASPVGRPAGVLGAGASPSVLPRPDLPAGGWNGL